MKQRMGQQEKAGGPDDRLCSPLDLTIKPFNGVVRPYPCPPPDDKPDTDGDKDGDAADFPASAAFEMRGIYINKGLL